MCLMSEWYDVCAVVLMDAGREGRSEKYSSPYGWWERGKECGKKTRGEGKSEEKEQNRKGKGRW